MRESRKLVRQAIRSSQRQKLKVGSVADLITFETSTRIVSVCSESFSRSGSRFGRFGRDVSFEVFRGLLLGLGFEPHPELE